MLEVEELSVSYGKHHALDAASLTVGRGEIVVILGANGAGKTSLLKAVCGVSDGRVTGTVRLDGIDISALPPHRIVEEGLALVPEGRGVFPEMSVRENLTLGAYSDRARDEEAANLERVFALFPKLAERRRQTVRTMSGGEQQMVAVGRAMMSNPAILALDEPSLGLSPLLCRDLFQSLLAVRRAGLGMLLVEQNARQSLAIADRGYLLENGHIVHEDRAEALLKDPAVQKAYLGGAAAATTPKITGKTVSAMRKPDTSPSDIAAAAMKSVATGRPEPRPSPQPVPTPPPRPEPRPQPPMPPSEPRPPRSAPKAGRSASEVLGGVDIGDLVSRARAASDRRASPSNGADRSPVTVPARAAPPVPPMPDLASSADRLHRVMAEIEAAARKAESYRPQTPAKRR